MTETALLYTTRDSTETTTATSVTWSVIVFLTWPGPGRKRHQKETKETFSWLYKVIEFISERE